MGISIGVVGAGQFSRSFIPLFQAHPDVSEVRLTEIMPDRLKAEAERHGIEKTYATVDELYASDVDAIAIFTQRWTHGPLVVQARSRRASTCIPPCPMAISVEEIAAIIEAVRETGLTYMMGETSYYNPATVYAAQQDRGRARSAGSSTPRATTSTTWTSASTTRTSTAAASSGRRPRAIPPMLYPTHSVGGVLGAIGGHAVSVSCIGVQDERGDGVFDREVSMFGNDFSNATALFELAGGGSMRTNEFRRVGYPSHIRERRFRYFGTEGRFEQIATVTRCGRTKRASPTCPRSWRPPPSMDLDDPSLDGHRAALRDAFVSGLRARARRRPPRRTSARACPNGHEGSHHFLVDDFVTAVVDRHPPAGERLGGGPLHAAGHRRAPVGQAGRRPAPDPRPRGRSGVIMILIMKA